MQHANLSSFFLLCTVYLLHLCERLQYYTYSSCVSYFCKENQDKLHVKEIDQYQQELTALQSSYLQKIATLNKKHKQELLKLQDEKEELTQRCEELEEQLVIKNKSGVWIKLSLLFLFVALIMKSVMQCYSLIVFFLMIPHPIFV